MTHPAVQRARALDAKATPGPWVLDESTLMVGCEETVDQATATSLPDAEFIAAARTLLPELAEAYEALEGENDSLRRLCGTYYVPLNALARTEDDGRRCTCTLVRLQTDLEPEEWEQDPECDQHGDIRYIKTECDRVVALNARLTAALCTVLNTSTLDSQLTDSMGARFAARALLAETENP